MMFNYWNNMLMESVELQFLIDSVSVQFENQIKMFY